MSTDDELFTPTEVLGGFSAKRARLLLFQIENRTASLMLQSRRAVARYLTEEAAEQQDLAFFEALAVGRELPVRPTMRDLERYAPHWQSLVPPNPTLQATLAHLLGQKYRFRQRDIPHVREALGLDREGVQQAFLRQYHQSLETIYTSKADPFEQVRWRWNKLSGWVEHLPPFWTTYALIFTETVGAGILALPIALAGVGPLPGIGILLAIGFINMLTIAAMAEAVTRNGAIRYQGNYLGRLVRDYLGRPGSWLLTIILVIDGFLALFAYYFGFSLTLAAMTPVRAEVWVGVLFLLGCFFVRRNTLHATVASALLVGAITLSLILLLCGLALPHLQLQYLLYVHVPFLNGQPFEAALLGLVFGVVYGAYFGHFSVSSCARTVLQRDPSGRSLLWGGIAAQVSAILLYILWVVAINGAIAPRTLIGFTGTALTPLANLVGPAAIILGSILVILAMGMASIHISLALFFTAREWVPEHARYTLLLRRRQGKLIFTSRGKDSVSLTLTYLGQQGMQPQFRLELQRAGEMRRFEIEMNTTWELTPFLAEHLPHLPTKSIRLNVQIVMASAEIVRLQLVTTMRVSYEGTWDTLGFDFQELADAPETADMALVSWLASQEQASMEEMHRFLQTEQNPQAVVDRLVEQGTLVETRKEGQVLYQVHFAARRRRQVPTALWQALATPEQEASQTSDADRQMQRGRWLLQLKKLVQGEQARSWLGLSPLLLIFIVAEWLLVNNLESFSELMSFMGVVTVAILAGVFPVLLLVASRRKGENVPGFVLSFLAHPLVVGGIYLVAVGTLFLHGLFIWQDPFQRVVALFVGGVVLVTTALMVRKGAFARRVVIEVRQDVAEVAQESGTFQVSDCGRAATQAMVWLGYTDGERVYQAASGTIAQFSALCSAKFHLPATQAQELMVWVHRVTPEGQSENLPALLKVSSGTEIREFHVGGTRKQFVLPLRDATKKENKGSPGEVGQLEVEVQLAARTT
jgi:amino acid permease